MRHTNEIEMYARAAVVTALVLIALGGGYVAHAWVVAARPVATAIVADHRDEIPLVRIESFDGNILRGRYEGREPRFLVGRDEQLIVPEYDDTFAIDLRHIR